MPTLVEARAHPAFREASKGREAPLLSVQDLHLHFVTSRGVVRAVEGISYEVHPGEMVAIVGVRLRQVGVGASIMRLCQATARIVSGKIMFNAATYGFRAIGDVSAAKHPMIFRSDTP